MLVFMIMLLLRTNRPKDKVTFDSDFAHDPIYQKLVARYNWLRLQEDMRA